jgi:hypothetical protein
VAKTCRDQQKVLGCTGAPNTRVIIGTRLESELGYHTASEPIAFHGITDNAMG